MPLIVGGETPSIRWKSPQKTEPLTRVEGFWRYWPVVVGKVVVYVSHHCGMPLASYSSSENPETRGTAVEVPKDFERPYLFANESNGPGRCPCVISGNRIFVVSNFYLICVEGK